MIEPTARRKSVITFFYEQSSTFLKSSLHKCGNDTATLKIIHFVLEAPPQILMIQHVMILSQAALDCGPAIANLITFIVYARNSRAEHTRSAAIMVEVKRCAPELLKLGKT